MPLPRVHLASFRVRAYRSCKSAAFSPDARLTALIGSNGSGKTNLMQGLMLLCGPQGRRYRQNEEDVSTLESRISATFVVNEKAVGFRASIVYRPTEGNRDQLISSDERWNFREITRKNEWLYLPYRDFIRSLASRPLERQRVYYHYNSINGREPLPRNLSVLMEAIGDFRRRTLYYSASQFTNPSLCPPSFEIDEGGNLYDQSTPDGSSREHLQFIHQLYRMFKTQQPLYSTYISLVDKRGVKLIDKLQWKEHKSSTKAYEVKAGGKVITTTRTRFVIIPTVYIGDSHLSFAQLSEGTFRTLAILFYVVTGSSRLLLIEEPEVCVHHGLLTSVIEIIREFSQEKQIIFSTHSEAILDKLEPEHVRLVSRRNSGTVVSTVSKSMSARQYRALKNYLETEGSLGEYWRHSGFEQ